MKNKNYLSPKAAVATVALVLACLSGCIATLECGTWAFTGTPSGNSFPLSSAFTFNPANCGKNCQCDQDVMIQMVWAYDISSGTYLYPNSGQAARATSNGWSIDQISGEAYGYYGLINDGKTFASFWNTPGSNGTPNTLFDDPSGWGPNTWFYALDVATCFSSKTCKNTILGYYFWSYIIDATDNGSKFIIGTAWKDLNSEFQSAVAGWNAWAPTSGVEVGTSGIPGEPSLPKSVPLPTLTDL